jgi:hypothetical protein
MKRILTFLAYLAVVVIILLVVLKPRWVFGAGEVLAEPVRESVDLLEVNHFFDLEGRRVFAQLCFYDWSNELARYDCLGFRIIKTGDQWPQRNWSSGGGYYVVWHDNGILRRVDSQAFVETWAQDGTNAPDPEVAARDFTPKNHRRDLRNPIFKRVFPKPIEQAP